MATTLYRKYRPQVFRDVVGQLHVKTTLLAELTSGAIAHAYLFVGPRGIGKTTMARLLAKAVNCENPKNGEPDNTCASCVSVNAGRSLDLIEIDAASHTQVDHVREYILPSARTAPALGRYKTFIIDEVHMLSISAFNALLKMLEEPPPHVIFILATTEVHRIPPTIISRCQRFDFHRVGPNETVQRLGRLLDDEGIRVDRAVLERIARLSQGSLRDAESILGQVIALGDKHITADSADVVLPRSDLQSAALLLEHILTGEVRPALELIQRLIDEGIQVAPFMQECVDLARALLLTKYNVDSVEVRTFVADVKDFPTLAGRMSIDLLRNVIDVFLRRERDERYTTLQQLPLELAVIELASPPQNSVTDTAGTGVLAETRPTTEPKKKNILQRDGLNLSITAVTARWREVQESIKTSNPSLALLLNSAIPHAIVDGKLTLVVPYVLHRERILAKPQRLALEQAASACFKMTVSIEVVVAAASETKKPNVLAGNDVWQQVLQTFSGSENRASE